ncbi:vitamin K-dependent gamma-carboxylase-like protein [Haloactinopolyspora alba]|uniref:Vitamin K-dependent gamma-carboxylase-like protein n=1 Tax=Haloactinopolyspora alba TaxID=648780 RepID=A0A2P8E9I3_9ACTN|nr:HTTM domain-containing protein [Haloactinopolyspora alba]PSL06105.1 vitamin K-dependent gamma-carboxylase-like protein [Haloactinopolyspora alba]
MIGEAWREITAGMGRVLDSGERWLFDGKKATYGLAVMRILFGVMILGTLTVNFADRHYVWGPGARWLSPWLTVDDYGFPFTWVFGAGDPAAVFTLKYLLLMALAVAFMLGWRTRVVTPLLMIAVASLMRLNPIADDAGDNLVRIMLLFLCFADTARHWSLDARRRAREDYRPLVPLPSWTGVLFHNVALLAVSAQIFIVYMTSGLSKVQGDMWQEGVGLYYPLQIDQYVSWPALNEIVYASGLFVTAGSYVTVFVQVLFPLLLMRRGTRVVALLLIFSMHVGIAVTMALPWFSLAMIAADAVFVRDVTYRALARWLRRSRRGEGDATAGDGDATAGDGDATAGDGTDSGAPGEPVPTAPSRRERPADGSEVAAGTPPRLPD